jgi:hypothetical protein
LIAQSGADFEDRGNPQGSRQRVAIDVGLRLM